MSDLISVILRIHDALAHTPLVMGELRGEYKSIHHQSYRALGRASTGEGSMSFAICSERLQFMVSFVGKCSYYHNIILILKSFPRHRPNWVT